MIYAAPALADEDLEKIAIINGLRDSLRYRIEQHPREWHGSLRRDMAAMADRGSNSIEGYNATIDDAKAIANGDQPNDANENITDVYKGYQRGMRYVMKAGGDKDFLYCPEVVKAIHFMITEHDPSASAGLWRTTEVWVQDRDGDPVYKGPPHEQLPALMAALMDSLDECADGSCPGDPTLVRAAMAHLNLVMIHPFRDGNGRTSRALQTLTLLREGVVGREFCSIEEQLGRDTQGYYKILGEVGQGEWSPKNDALPWVRYALDCHLKQATRVRDRFDAAEKVWERATEVSSSYGHHPRTVNALFDAVIGGVVRNQSYRRSVEIAYEPISQNVAGRDLGKLVESGLLEQKGAKRGARYIATDKLRSEISYDAQQLALFK